MARINETDRLFIDESVAGYAKGLVESGVVARQVDLLLLGFAYAVRNDLDVPAQFQRHEIVRAAGVDPDSRMAVEAVAPWYAREKGIQEPKDSRELLDLVCRLGSAGIAELQSEWSGKAKTQIELSILRLGSLTREPESNLHQEESD